VRQPAEDAVGADIGAASVSRPDDASFRRHFLQIDLLPELQYVVSAGSTWRIAILQLCRSFEPATNNGAKRLYQWQQLLHRKILMLRLHAPLSP